MVPVVVVLGLALAGLAGACTDDGRAGEMASDDGERPVPNGGAGAPSDPTSDPSDPGATNGPASEGPLVTTDRCLVGACETVRLPPQPDLPFLEGMGEGWQRLMEADWVLAAGTEGYRCMTLTVPDDTRIVEFAAQSPRGTHHATFGIYPEAQGPDGVVACGVGAGGERRLHGSGAGSESISLPDGVGMVLHKGEQILMNLHLFNPTESMLTGRSGMWVKTATAEEIEYEAESVLAGPLQLTIPAGRSVQGGGCTVRSDATLYGLGPHMHQLGVHMRVTVVRSGAAELEVYDDSYDFNHQLFYDIDPVQLSSGDRVNVECTYENDTGRTVTWGDSSLDEMCFASLGLYPAGSYGSLPCFN